MPNLTADALQVVFLCGGRGIRMREGMDRRPKALMEVGGRPIIWHIMKSFAHHGFTRFVLCLGYGSQDIREYFHSYAWRRANTRLRTRTGELTFLDGPEIEDWTIDFIETGADAETAERILNARGHIHSERFVVTYADDLANVDIGALVAFHEQQGRIAALAGVLPESPFGELEVENGLVTDFVEKPRLTRRINGGFYVFRHDVFDYLKRGALMEQRPLQALAEDRQLAVFEHDGFFLPLNTRKDLILANKLWYDCSNTPPWKVWD
jgi:glucose-1-phosphate cytidylyltransferase